MSALVCGKRSSSIFEELVHTPPPASKRARCAAVGASPSFSPTAAFRLSPARASALASNSPSSDRGDLYTAHLAHLRSLFPDMDQQVLEKALHDSGDDLNSTIQSLHDLCLESAERTNSGAMNNIGVDAAVENPPAAVGLPTDGCEWVELFVREMMNASDMDDAKSRASGVLEVLEKSIMARAGAEAIQSFHKENMILKEQLEVLLQENSVLKRAVAIQHERQKEHDEKSQELQHLKQLVSQYQEQLRTLEVNNYALTMHLRQAQQNSSIPGRFHPDVF